MELSLALICEEVRERPDGRLDVIGVFHDLAAPGFPALQDRMTVLFVMDWSVEERGPQVFRADLVDDDEDRVMTIEGETDVDARIDAPARTRLVLPLERVVFPHEGRYRFLLVAGGDVHEACSLSVRLHTEPAIH
ncbi:MAG: hypothetical protein L0271_10810 [Gemmatimonadetes bacterium]|nr:hypothetical protein [Gemmatimonadota bacterium]